MLQFFGDNLTYILGAIFAILAAIICLLSCVDLCGKTSLSEDTKKTLAERESRRSFDYERSKQPPYATRERTTQPTRPIPGISHAVKEVPKTEASLEGKVKALRGGEFIGNRMRFKVKVINDSPYIIADVSVFLISYPEKSLRYSGDEHLEFFPKIEPGGFRSPTFDFLPTKDCVRGEIVAGVSYLDMRGKAHTLTTEPFIIRSVCDLLLPQQITPDDFALRLREHESGELCIEIKEWTPEEMYEKALRIVDESNFFEVSTKFEKTEDIVYAKIRGFAKGKYTGKSVAVEIDITGPSRVKGASCTIRVSGEDEAMILPAIDDLKERLSAWMCPLCGSPLTLDNVKNLRDGKVIQCPFCNASIGR